MKIASTRRVVAAVSLSIALTATGLLSGTANAGVHGRIIPLPYKVAQEVGQDGVVRSVVPRFKETNLEDRTKPAIATCVAEPGVGCSLGQARTSAFTIGGEFGVSAELLSATLQISDQESTEITINCPPDPTASPGSVQTAYPLFTRIHFTTYEGGTLAPPVLPPGEKPDLGAATERFIDVPQQNAVSCPTEPR